MRVLGHGDKAASEAMNDILAQVILEYKSLQYPTLLLSLSKMSLFLSFILVSKYYSELST